MEKNIRRQSIEDDALYPVEETSIILEVTTQTITKYLRSGELKGQKRGPKKKWHVTGASIKEKMKEWNML